MRPLVSMFLALLVGFAVLQFDSSPAEAQQCPHCQQQTQQQQPPPAVAVEVTSNRLFPGLRQQPPGPPMQPVGQTVTQRQFATPLRNFLFPPRVTTYYALQPQTTPAGGYASGPGFAPPFRAYRVW